MCPAGNRRRERAIWRGHGAATVVVLVPVVLHAPTQLRRPMGSVDVGEKRRLIDVIKPVRQVDQAGYHPFDHRRNIAARVAGQARADTVGLAVDVAAGRVENEMLGGV